jgi:hypothetical protein
MSAAVAASTGFQFMIVHLPVCFAGEVVGKILHPLMLLLGSMPVSQYIPPLQPIRDEHPVCSYHRCRSTTRVRANMLRSRYASSRLSRTVSCGSANRARSAGNGRVCGSSRRAPRRPTRLPRSAPVTLARSEVRQVAQQYIIQKFFPAIFSTVKADTNPHQLVISESHEYGVK